LGENRTSGQPNKAAIDDFPGAASDGDGFGLLGLCAVENL
jgi:hypothetical protein